MPARSFPFLDVGVIIAETEGRRRWGNSVASFEKVRLRWEESLA